MGWVEDLFDDPVYDLEYAKVLEDEDRTTREADFIAREVGLSAEHEVLDLACGHGRHALVIAKRVSRVVGYDRTERFLEHARKRASESGVANVEFIVGDMRELAYESQFDAAYNFFTAWGYYSDEENFDVLVRVARALKPGGRFLLDMINRDALVRRFQSRDWQELEDGTIVLYEHWLDFATGRVHSKRTYLRPSGRKTVELDHRVPAPEELMRLFAEAGFAETRLVSFPDGGALTMDSRRLAVIGTKP